MELFFVFEEFAWQAGRFACSSHGTLKWSNLHPLHTWHDLVCDSAALRVEALVGPGFGHPGV